VVANYCSDNVSFINTQALTVAANVNTGCGDSTWTCIPNGVDTVPNPQLHITTGAPGPLASPLPDATTGLPYVAWIAVRGGLRPLTWEEDVPVLAACGLALDPTTGIISGVPPAPGVCEFRIRVTDSEIPNQVRERSFAITVF